MYLILTNFTENKTSYYRPFHKM